MLKNKNKLREVLLAVALVLTLGLVPATLVGANPDPGIVGLWYLDEGTGSIASDSSGNLNHGTLQGDTSWVSGKFGSALSFDGSGDYVEVADSTSLNIITGGLTIEAWVKEATSGTRVKIVSRRISRYFYLLGVDNGKPYGGIGDGSTATVTSKTVTMPNDEWHHLAFVYDDAADEMYLYYDGVLKETVGVTESLPSRTGVKLSIGADFEGRANFFNGTIDEVRIWDEALSADEVFQSYVEGRFTRTPGFWCTHPDVINDFGLLPVTVCGQELNTTDAGYISSTSEALSIAIEGDIELQLARQCTAAALNCAAAGACFDEYDFCCTDCSSVPMLDGDGLNCIEALDIFNNSGDAEEAPFDGYAPADPTECKEAKKTMMTIFGVRDNGKGPDKGPKW